MKCLCIPHLLAEQAQRAPDALALLAPGRAPLTYGRLQRHVHDVVHNLHRMGVGRHDRVAVAIPNGPEMAVAFLAVAAGATCAPLNPHSSANECALYLAGLHAQALVVQAGIDSPARAVAQAYGIDILELSPMLEAEAGLFTLTSTAPPHAVPDGLAQPDDVAIVLYTSGTTSQPKIVPLTHTNICTSAYATRDALALSEPDRCLNVQPLFHVAGLVSALLGSLAAGASMVCLPDFSAPAFFAALAEFHPTWYMAVPAVHQAILARAALHRELISHCALRFIRAGSAALPPHVLTELERVFQVPVLASYGATEAAGIIACNPLPPRQRKPGSVGLAAGLDVTIMDQGGTVLPAGETGEIVLRGASVMPGYDNNPTANSTAFTSGWFRTGDLGFLDSAGYLFITGRLKELINRGGEKIAPWEVDVALMDHPAVAQAVTFAVPDSRLGEEVAAAVVLHPHAVATANELRQFVAARLAAFKVPRHIVLVEDLPQGPTGKLPRLGLAEQFALTLSEQTQATMDAASTAPPTPLEETLAALGAQVLHVEHLGRHEDFFQMGGDSLLATQLLSRIRKATHIEVPFPSFFETPTVAGLARLLETAAQAECDVQVPPLCPVPRDSALPLSYPQQRLWFLEQLGLIRHAYHLVKVLRLRGPLRVAALAHSLQEISQRHEVLRTTFTQSAGQPRQVIGAVPPGLLSLLDVPARPELAWETQVYELASAEVQRPFNLEQGPLLRATLVRLGAEEHVLFLTMHHIVFDGWSDGVFWRELVALYEAFSTGQPSPLPVLPLQYADFAHWQLQWLQDQALSTHLAYWQRQLAGVSVLQLPTDRPRPPVQTFRGARHALRLSSTLTQALKALSQRHGVTLFMTLLAAFQTLLYRYTSQDDIAVGSPIANRTRVELEGLIGCFVNTVVLRTDMSGEPRFGELLHRVREVALGAYSHQDIPFEKLLEVLRPPRDLSRSPLFQVLCILHNTPQQPPALSGLTLSFLEVDPGTTKFDMTLSLTETPQGLSGYVEYSTDLFEAATIARLAGHFETLLAGIVAHPEQRLSQLPFLTAAQRQHRAVHGHRVRPQSPFRPFAQAESALSIPARFAQQVQHYPAHIAVQTAQYQWTYEVLNTVANRIARAILVLCGSQEARIGLLLTHDAPMIASIVGVLKSGNVYVPLDPFHPQERLGAVLEDSQARIIVTDKTYLTLAQALARDVLQIINVDDTTSLGATDNVNLALASDAPAYILYTSGSTGEPKGVVQSHANVLYFIGAYTNGLHISAPDRLTLLSTYSFDAAVMDIFGALLNGAALYPFDLRTEELTRLAGWLQREAITIYHSTPTVYRYFVRTLAAAQHFPALRIVALGGEAMYKPDVDLYKHHFAPHCLLVNNWGATECTLALQYCIDKQTEIRRHIVPVGYPVEGTEVLVRNDAGEVVEGYGLGEIVICSPHVALGYWRQPALTEAIFSPDPTGGNRRMYHTGDLGRWLPDGPLEDLSRRDHQVKIRGVRIEPAEIEVTLEQYPAIRQAAVVAIEEASDHPRLVAYLVAAQAPAPTTTALRSFLKSKLPDYMVPSAFVFLDALPLTSSGKINRRALPAPTPARPALAEAFVNPRTPTEEVLVGIWATVLGIEHVGVHDNFFDLGGHSLMAVQVMSRLRHALQVEVPVRALFEAPTVAELALYVETTGQAAPGVPEPAIRPVPRQEAVPVSVAQEQLWVLDQILPDTPFFNIFYAMRVLGPLNVALLEHSVSEIIRRHEALRTTFALVDRQLVQVIAPTLDVPLTMQDLRALSETEQEGEAQRLARAEARKPFDLAQGPLLRVHLLRLGEQEHLLFVTMHHIISDGWSLGVLAHELAVLYDAFAAGGPSPLPALPIQYGDFAHWQRQWQHSAARQVQLAYWQQQLRNPLPVLALSTDRSRATALSFRTARQSLVIPEALSAALTHLSRREGSTLFMTLLSAFKVLLYSYTGQADLCVGTLVANRNRQETEGLIGLLINTVILRTDLGGNPTLREVLQRVRATTLAAYARQDLPYAELVQTLEPAHAGEPTAPCQVLFILQNAMPRPLQLPDRRLSFVEADQYVVAPDVTATMFDLILMLKVRSQGLTGSCIYKTALCDAATINRVLEDFQRVLARMPSQLEQPLSTFDSLRDERG